MTENVRYMCRHCGSVHDLDDMVRCHDGLYCRQCVVQCFSCGDYIPITDARSFTTSNEYFCSDCYETNGFRCPRCNEFCDVNHSHLLDDGTRLCNDCYDDVAICDGCGDFVEVSDVRYDQDGNTLCQECYNRNLVNLMHDYSFKPRPIFHGSTARRYGVELEIDGGTRSGCISGLNNLSEDENLFYLKSDGSLSSCGIEIVTHPCDLEYHRTEFIWKDIVKVAKEHGYRSHDTTTCGLHIHVSRAGITDETILKIILLMDRFYDDILPISRRKRGSYESYASRYSMQSASIREVYNKNDHYKMVNLTDQTVEMRIFKGTLNTKSILASIEFYDAIIKMCEFLSVDVVLKVSFNDVMWWIKNVYASETLTKYLEFRGIEFSETSSIEEFIEEEIERRTETFDRYSDLLVKKQEEDITPDKTDYILHQYYNRFCVGNLPYYVSMEKLEELSREWKVALYAVKMSNYNNSPCATIINLYNQHDGYGLSRRVTHQIINDIFILRFGDFYNNLITADDVSVFDSTEEEDAVLNYVYFVRPTPVSI